MTQKKILLKSTRALELQCPLKFRCQTRDYIPKTAKLQREIAPSEKLSFVVFRQSCCIRLYNLFIIYSSEQRKKRGSKSLVFQSFPPLLFLHSSYASATCHSLRNPDFSDFSDYAHFFGSLTPPSSKNLSKRCKRLIFLSIF